MSDIEGEPDIVIDSSPPPVNAERLIVYSIDPGTVNMVFGKLSAYVDVKDKSRYFGVSLDWCEIINIKYATKEDDKLKINPRSDTQMIEALYEEFENGRLMKIHDEFTAHSIKFPKDKLTIIIEKQMDGIKGNKVPINYAISHAIHMWVLCKFPKDKIKYYEVGGSNKSGLRGIHDDERKKATISVACHSLRREGFYDMADYIESLKRPKPAQDASDMYNQGRCFLLKWLQVYGCHLPKEIEDLESFTRNSIKIVEKLTGLGPKQKNIISDTTQKKRKREEEEEDDEIDEPITKPKKKKPRREKNEEKDNKKKNKKKNKKPTKNKIAKRERKRERSEKEEDEEDEEDDNDGIVIVEPPKKKAKKN